MSPDIYIGLDGRKHSIDLDAVVRILKGMSALKKGWNAYIIYDPETTAFIELSSTKPDIRGNSKEASTQVADEYLFDTFMLSRDQVNGIRENPNSWTFLNLRP